MTSPTASAMAFFLPRTRFHFDELREVLEMHLSQNYKQTGWFVLSTKEEKIQLAKRLEIFEAALQKDNFELDGGLSYDITKSYKTKSPYEDGMRFQLHNVRERQEFLCRYYSTGLLIVEPTGETTTAEEKDFEKVFGAVCAIWPYLTDAIRLFHYGICKADVGQPPEEVILRCCDSFVAAVAKTYRDIKQRIGKARNPDGSIWPHPQGAKQSKAIKELVEEKLLFAFDAEQYLEMVSDCLKYFEEYIGPLDPSDRDIVKEDVKYMEKWTAMRREEARVVEEIDRHSSQLALQKLLMILSYEIIVLTFVQVIRTIYPTPLPDPTEFLTPVSAAVLLPFILITVQHYYGQKRVRWVLAVEFALTLVLGLASSPLVRVSYSAFVVAGLSAAVAAPLCAGFLLNWWSSRKHAKSQLKPSRSAMPALEGKNPVSN